MLKYRHMPHLTDYIARSLRGPVMSSTQKRAILQVRIREEDKQHAEHLYDAMGTSLAEERNAWIEYLATESDESVLGPEEVDIHE